MNARKSSRGTEANKSVGAGRTPRAGTSLYRVLSLVMAMLVVVSLSSWADVASAYGGVSPAAAVGEAQEKEAPAAQSDAAVNSSSSDSSQDVAESDAASVNVLAASPNTNQIAKGGSYTATAKTFSDVDQTAVFPDVLGDAVNYGVTTSKFIGNGDAETNVAAEVGSCSYQTGNDLSNPVTQTMLIGEIDGKFGVKGYSVYFRTSPESAGRVDFKDKTSSNHVLDTSMSKEDLQAEVQGMIKHVANEQEKLAKHIPNADILENESSQKYELDIQDREGGVYYVTLDGNLYKKIMEQDDKFHIYKKPGQTIIFNVAASGDLEMHKFSIANGDRNLKGSDSFLLSNAGDVPQQLIWNFTNATKITTVGSVTGIILATGADFYNNQPRPVGWFPSRQLSILANGITSTSATSSRTARAASRRPNLSMAKTLRCRASSSSWKRKPPMIGNR